MTAANPTDCSSAVAIPTTSLSPGYLNLTSLVAPANSSSGPARVTFTHYLKPETGRPDYSLTSDGSNNLVTSYGYDTFGRLIAKTMPKGNVGRLQPTTGLLSGSPLAAFTTTWTYYPAGATATPACTGATVADQRGLLQSESIPGTATTTTAHDILGRVRSFNERCRHNLHHLRQRGPADQLTRTERKPGHHLQLRPGGKSPQRNRRERHRHQHLQRGRRLRLTRRTPSARRWN